MTRASRAAGRSPVRLRNAPLKARLALRQAGFLFCAEWAFSPKHPIKMPQSKSPCHVYILYSPKKDRFYVGYSCQLADRIQRHQSGRSKSTKSGRPWLLVYLEGFDDSGMAYQREKQIKRRKSRKYLLELAKGYTANPFPIPN